MASRTESSGWSYEGSGSIWHGINSPLPRRSFGHDDPTWRGWQNATEHNDEYKRVDRRPTSIPSPLQPPDSDSNTLYMGNLEPWMDHEYASQVVRLMGWDRSPTASINQNSSVTIQIPPPPPDARPQPNNAGYCLLTFPSAAHAASVLASLHSGNNKDHASAPVLMPNSSRPFNLEWASPSHFPRASTWAVFGGSSQNAPIFSGAAIQPESGIPNQGPEREFSIFVGDLATETSNSDLVAIFKNPTLGLRNDRSSTGVSRGYGFVRFTDEADQQRALIEMHGLYCLSRPMRIAVATAKLKQTPATTIPAHPASTSLSLISKVPTPEGADEVRSSGASSTRAPSLVTSVASPVAAASSANSSTGMGSFPSSSPMSSQPPPHSGRTTILGGAALNGVGGSALNGGNGVYDEALAHQAQSRAILYNLIGPNGEQLTSTDPYNTTVFVGGLSPLISEETLRTFFAPFGDIHYVKVPLGKHCGFVQFVRKTDAERAIERMNGFPIGGSRIRLSWGRSQYNAAQAAAQAAQAAQAEQVARFTAAAEAAAAVNAQNPSSVHIRPDRVLQLLFSGTGNGSSGFPNAAFLKNPSGSFQVNDILRRDSQTLHPRVPSPSSQPQESLSIRTTPPQLQQRQQSHAGLHLRDDTTGCEFMHDLNGTLASLDLGDRYPRAATGSEMLTKDVYTQAVELRPLSKSISAPLNSLVKPRPKSGGSPDSP
ncbi:hypothetical protein JB92DRAFT_2836555 [Gautieria morchelliformis]|nr:hypothetical protein JB92DRAFT_2836555 [Gautieria morchelliformis]